MPKYIKTQTEELWISRQELITLVLNSLEHKEGFKVDFDIGHKIGMPFVNGVTCIRTVEIK